MSKSSTYEHPQRFKIIRGGIDDLAVSVSNHLNGFPVESTDGIDRYAYYQLHGPVFLSGIALMHQAVVWYAISESKRLPLEEINTSGSVH